MAGVLGHAARDRTPMVRAKQPERYALWGIALLSASLLAYQVLLTRVCALRLHFHFGYLIISNCLLGIGASGTVLALTEHRWKKAPREYIWKFTLSYLVSLGLTWVFLLSFQVPDSLHFTSVGEAVRFGVFNLAAAVPFFFGGTAVGLILTAHAAHVNKVYAADLVGAGLGCLLCPILLWPVGAGGCFLAVALLGFITLAIVAPKPVRRPSLQASGVGGLMCLVLMPFFDAMFPVPGKGFLDLTDTFRAKIAAYSEYSRWSANSRIDLLPMPPQLRFMFCRGARTKGLPLSDQKFILQDGDAGTIISNFSDDPNGLVVLKRSMYSASVRLKEGKKPRVFIIGMGGGNDVWAAKVHGADSVRAVELNRGVVEIHTKVVPHFSRRLFEDPKVSVIVDEGRTALMRETGKFDIVQMTGIDTWTSLTSGAYILAESYLYTQEAIAEMYDHLADGGILQIIRMAAEMETLRLIGNVDAALSKRGASQLPRSIMALSTADQLSAVMVKKGEFTQEEIDSTRLFAARSGIAITYMPGQTLGNIVEDFIRTDKKDEFIAAFPRDISPTTDDRPYFFNFSRWSKPISSAKYMREATNVSQGNPLFIIGQFAFSSLLATLFIVGPLLVFRRRRTAAEAAAAKKQGRELEAEQSERLGLVTFAYDDIDWEDELRVFLEERASFSPDAMVGLEANLRFAGPETMETRIFGRLTAWQNWIFNRPNAVGKDGALQRYGTGQRGDYAMERV